MAIGSLAVGGQAGGDGHRLSVTAAPPRGSPAVPSPGTHRHHCFFLTILQGLQWNHAVGAGGSTGEGEGENVIVGCNCPEIVGIIFCHPSAHIRCK